MAGEAPRPLPRAPSDARTHACVRSQVQAILALTLVAIIAIYTAVTFRNPPSGLPTPVPNDITYSGASLGWGGLVGS